MCRMGHPTDLGYSTFAITKMKIASKATQKRGYPPHNHHQQGSFSVDHVHNTGFLLGK